MLSPAGEAGEEKEEHEELLVAQPYAVVYPRTVVVHSYLRVRCKGTRVIVSLAICRAGRAAAWSLGRGRRSAAAGKGTAPHIGGKLCSGALVVA